MIDYCSQEKILGGFKAVFNAVHCMSIGTCSPILIENTSVLPE